MKQVLAKLNQARKLFRSKQHAKSGWNDYSKFNYFEKGDFLPDALDAFDEFNLSGVCSFDSELGTISITDLDSGEVKDITIPWSTAKLTACHEVQNVGAVVSYLGRYLWATAVELIEADKLDSSSGSELSRNAAPLPTRPSAPKSEAAPVAAREADEDEQIWPVTILGIEEKTTKKGDPFITLKLNNKKFVSIFNDKDREHFSEGRKVNLIVKPDGKYWKYVGVEEERHEGKLEFVDTIVSVEERDRDGKQYYKIELGNGSYVWTDNKLVAGEAYDFVPDANEFARNVRITASKGKGDALIADSIEEEK